MYLIILVFKLIQIWPVEPQVSSYALLMTCPIIFLSISFLSHITWCSIACSFWTVFLFLILSIPFYFLKNNKYCIITLYSSSVIQYQKPLILMFVVSTFCSLCLFYGFMILKRLNYKFLFLSSAGFWGLDWRYVYLEQPCVCFLQVPWDIINPWTLCIKFFLVWSFSKVTLVP